MTTKNLVTNAQAYGIYVLLALALFLVVGTAHADVLNRQLSVGMSGSDVSALQTFLATDGSVYPQALVTGYYGSLTEAAVSNFQTLNGIAAVGRVGPITLPVLNQQISGGASTSTSAPVISSVSVVAMSTSAMVDWNTNEAARGVVYYSTSALTTSEQGNAVNVNGQSAITSTSYNTSQSVSLSNLQANTVYYYLVYTIDEEGNISVTWPTTFRTKN